LATTAQRQVNTRCSIEVYPHPALLSLLKCDYRIPYKVSKSNLYWPGTSLSERISKILTEFEKINLALSAVYSNVPLSLPLYQNVTTLAVLKRYEDALDALVCAWVGLRFASGDATPYGDDTAAIWVPKVKRTT
jgi:predicted RNase H-like nuclease